MVFLSNRQLQVMPQNEVTNIAELKVFFRNRLLVLLSTKTSQKPYEKLSAKDCISKE